MAVGLRCIRRSYIIRSAGCILAAVFLSGATLPGEVPPITDGNGCLRSDHRYRDFVLELSYRPLKEEAWDSGIFFRCEEPPAGQPWPRRYQVNLKQHEEGILIGVPEARSRGLVRAGQWNQLRLTVVGSRASLQINGQPAWTTDRIEAAEGYLAIQVETPLGGQFAFRDLYVTELGHRPLFNGRDLEGWEGAGQPADRCWRAENGELVCTGKPGPWLRSREQFGDFNLRLEYKLQPGGNSGVYVRVPADGDHHGRDSGVEVQILDDAAERYRGLKPYQFSGSLYAIAAAEPQVTRAAGRWNSLEINCRGTRYQVLQNGVLIVDADLDDYPALGERRLAGYLGLQNHREQVGFRHLRLGPPFRGSPAPAPPASGAK